MKQIPLSVQAGRIVLSSSHPYLSTALWRMDMVVSEQVPTMGVDKFWRLYINEEFTSQLTSKAIATILYHEVLHLLRSHSGLAMAMDAHPRVWNIAADCEINDDLMEERLEFPDKEVLAPVLPSTFKMKDKLLSEEYYNKLMENATFVEVHMSGGSGDPDDNSSTEGQSGSSPGSSAGVMAGECGSGATGKKESWEQGEKGDSGVSEVESEIIRQAVAEAVREHVSNKGIGSIPGHLARWSEKFLSPPKIPWQRELTAHLKKSFSTSAGRVNYSYARPTRRQSAYGKVVMPSMRRPNPVVAVIVDTSGSMGENELSAALSEVKGILMSVGQRSGVTVLSVDAAVHTSKKVFDVRQVEVVGGGGTDMGVGLSAAERLRPQPSVVVVLTDCYTPWPEFAPPFDVIVGATSGYSDGVPSWAKTVLIE